MSKQKKSLISIVTVLSMVFLNLASSIFAQSTKVELRGGSVKGVDSFVKETFVEGPAVKIGDPQDRPSAPLATTLLDTFTISDTKTTTTGTPRTYIGNGFTNNSLPAGTTSFQITSITVYMASLTAASYTNIRTRVQFFNTHNGSSTPVFSNSAGALVVADAGPLTISTANTFVPLTITLNPAVTLTGGSGTNWGFAVNFQGDTGAGPVDNTNLTSLLTANSASTFNAGTITNGTAPVYGFYRNASARTDFNFIPTDLRTFTGLNAIATAIIISGNALGPTAAGVEVSGRVLTSNGRGIRNAVVNIRDRSGNVRTAITGPLGTFNFEDVESGESYVVSVVSRRFSFSPRVVQIADNVSDLNFVSEQ